MHFEIKEINNLLPGDIILHPIYRKDGLILINRFKKITPSLLKHLRTHCEYNMPIVITRDANQDFQASDIRPSFSDNPELSAVLNAVYEQHCKQFFIHPNIEAYLEHSMEQTLQTSDLSNQTILNFDKTARVDDVVKRLFTNPLWVKLDETISSPEVARRTSRVKQNIFRVIHEDSSISNLFGRITSYHDVLATHSVNTMAIAFAIGLTLELTEEQLTNLVIATLLADIGYTQIPKPYFISMLNTDDRVQYINVHIRDTIELIKTSPTCQDKSIILGILDHHEHVDGSGYPQRKRGQDISLFGRVIGIAQAYDEYVGGYIQETSYSIFTAQSMIWNERNIKWDADILRAYTYRRNFLKIGHQVIFTDNRTGEIIGFTDFANAPIHPIIQLDSGEKINLYNKDLACIRYVQV